MQSSFSRRLGLQLLALVLGFSLFACQTTANPATVSQWQGKTVYSRVGMKVEPARRGGAGWHMYSTNHIGLQKHIPPGTKFTVQTLTGNKLSMVGDDGLPVQLEFTKRSHPDLTFETWLDRQLSQEEVDLPGSLSSKEEEAIEAGRYEVGMSREALFLAIGYPPASLSPSLNDSTLTYEIKRFNRIVFALDAEGKVTTITD